MGAIHFRDGRYVPNQTAQTTETDAYAALERDAKALARSTRGETPNTYIVGGTTRGTPERAVAQALEADPDVYNEYRARHNAGAILHTLAQAGVHIG